MKTRFILCITVLFVCHPLLWSQALTMQLPQSGSGAAGSTSASGTPGAGPTELPDDPSPASDLPIAQVAPASPIGEPVHISSNVQSKMGDLFTLSGEVEIRYRDYVVRADTATYNNATSTVEATGHLQLDGGPDDEHVTADHGTIDLDKQQGHFFDVIGTIGLRSAPHTKPIYTSPNPFIFTGREVFKDGPDRYRVLGGSMTSCRLPKPDWRLLSAAITVRDGKASARNSIFKLLQVPVFYLPYVTHPVDSEGRQSGFLIPTFATSSTKGTIFGEEVYWAINRSMDVALGAEYYSKRGFAPHGQFRVKGRGQNFLDARFHSLFDRLPPATNQGGEDILVDGRYDFNPHTRAVADIEYLSSYLYRQAFEENFAIAISSEVKSQAFVTRSYRGISESIRFDRYQSFESQLPLVEVRILHTPTLSVEATDHMLPRSRLTWGFYGAAGGLSRSEPGLQTSRFVGRTDLYPRLVLPLAFRGWNFRPEIAVRDTFYTKSENLESGVPTQRDSSLNRKDFEAGFELHPPVLERDFTAPWLIHLLGGELRHTIETDARYQYVSGIHNFRSVLRFDDTDIASDTNEVEYSMTHRLFLRHMQSHPCKQSQTPAANGECGVGTSDWLSWQIAQKYFFDPRFGHAVIPGTRNVLTTTLDLTGVAFLTNPRYTSPIVSRLRMRSTSATDLEWDLDYDTRLGRITSSNVFATYRHDDYSIAVGHAKLDAPEGTVSPTSAANLAAATSNYNQLRLLFSYGNPSHPGFSAAANAGYDLGLNSLQFGGIQTAYNWNCCGISVEYRRFALGSARNENQYLYNFTLAGIGTAGNLRRAAKIF
jgi:LPS-assembly protein